MNMPISISIPIVEKAMHNFGIEEINNKVYQRWLVDYHRFGYSGNDFPSYDKYFEMLVGTKTNGEKLNSSATKKTSKKKKYDVSNLMNQANKVKEAHQKTRKFK